MEPLAAQEPRRLAPAEHAAHALAQARLHVLEAEPKWSKAVKWAALEAAGLSTRGSGWDPSGQASSWECQAAQGRQARPDEAQELSWATANTYSRRSIDAGWCSTVPVRPQK